jgi:plastocyanin
MTIENVLRSAAVAGALALALSACGGDDDKPGSVVTVPGATGAVTDKVDVKDFTFNPSSTSVKVGSTVTWTFNDDVDHNVEPTAASELKKSPDLQGGKTYEFKFTKPGTVAYRCGIHNSMTGTVVVTA